MSPSTETETKEERVHGNPSQPTSHDTPDMGPTLDYRVDFEPHELYETHPPVWRSLNKVLALERVVTENMVMCPSMAVSRWLAGDALPPPRKIEEPVELVVHHDVFPYGPEEEGTVEWHMNFSDPHLLCAYGSPLLAQDEHQALEHPVLGALREWLDDTPKCTALTVQAGRPTPVLVARVPRLCHVDTQPSTGAPEGLYGWRFDAARKGQVQAATTPLVLPTTSQLLCMAAPNPGGGLYTPETIAHVLRTAFAGYRAIREETRRLWASTARVSLTTGYWGCGAFGGNRTLMALLQLLAARLARLDRVVFCTVTADKVEPLEEARAVLENHAHIWARASSLTEVARAIAAQGFVWEQSDGN